MAKRNGWSRRRADPVYLEQAQLEQELEQTRRLIAQAYSGFNATTDPELVESYVYEIQSLQARYSYLLRQRKALEKPVQVTQPVPQGDLVPRRGVKLLSVLPSLPAVSWKVS